MGRRRVRLIAGAASLLLLLPVGLCGLAAAALLQMLHMPRTVIADAPGTELVDLKTRDGVVLKGAWVPASATTQDCVIVLHGAGGWRGRSQRFLPWLNEAGYSVLAPDLRAHGESGGDTVTYGLLEQFDTLGWVSWLRNQGCARIYGMGESLGASVLIMAAAADPSHRPFEAIVAEAPFADLLEAAEQRGQRLFPLPAYIAATLAQFAVAGGSLYARFSEGLDFSQSLPVQSIAKLDIPILLIHGTADNRTPPSHSEELRAANPRHTTLWLVPRARHVGSYTTAPEEYRARVLALFRTRT